MWCRACGPWPYKRTSPLGAPQRRGRGTDPAPGRPFRIASPPWAEVIDAMDDPALQQVVLRGSVQSGKTAALIAAALGHMAAGRSVLIFEPDDKLKRALATRVARLGPPLQRRRHPGGLRAEAATLRTHYGRGRAL